MADWTAGYVADIGYTFGYYSELNIERLALAINNASYKTPAIKTACELGFGQGMSVALNSAASNIEWWGTDFNPSQASFAQDLVREAGLNAKLFDQSFTEFCTRTDLPDFDFIGMHGIWSWISDENRLAITDFIRRKLRPGGVLYISYNTQPGWASMLPVRELMYECSKRLTAEVNGREENIGGTIEFIDKLLKTDPIFFKANPEIADRINKIKEQNRRYLAHEYFNRDWAPMSFLKVTDWLDAAKISWVCSAHYLDSIDVLNLTEVQQSFKNNFKDVALQQALRDFFVNQQFRRDYWIKGARKISGFEQIELIRSQKILLIQPASDISLKAIGALGEAALQEQVYLPYIEALATHNVTTLGQIEELLLKRGITLGQILQATLVLASTGAITPVSINSDDASIQSASRRLNDVLIRQSRGNPDLAFLASPLAGGGISVPRFQQLFLLARQQGHKTSEQWAKFTWEILSAQGQRLIKEGKTLETPEENFTELTAQAKEFADKRLAVLQALQIA